MALPPSESIIVPQHPHFMAQRVRAGSAIAPGVLHTWSRNRDRSGPPQEDREVLPEQRAGVAIRNIEAGGQQRGSPTRC